MMEANAAKFEKPGTEHRALDIFEGKWITHGTIHAVGGEKAAEMHAVDQYEWLPGGFFMVHHVDARMDGVPAQSIEVIGYDAGRGCYVTRSYDDKGSSAEFTARLEGDNWEIDGEPMRFRGAFKDNAATLSGTWEQLGDGGKWTPWIDIELRKVT
ncbi:MAG: DUF1579 family protein [Burkholderiaceae bacterium]|nr:DUF1579 family protein [Burkholderiaceae bacterium]